MPIWHEACRGKPPRNPYTNTEPVARCLLLLRKSRESVRGGATLSDYPRVFHLTRLGEECAQGITMSISNRFTVFDSLTDLVVAWDPFTCEVLDAAWEYIGDRLKQGRTLSRGRY